MKIKLGKNTYDIIVVFFLLFLSVGFVVSNDLISSSMTIGLWLFLLFVIFRFWGGRINRKLLSILILLLSLMLFTTIVRKESVEVYLKIAFSVFVICLYVSNTTFDRFSVAYVTVMKFLCIVSLVGYGLHLVVPSIFSKFIVQNTAGISFSNYVLYVQWISSGQNAYRNWGFAWEPGAFSTFVCLAMLLDVIFVSEKIRLRTLILYVLTVITTFSTTGILAIICLCIFLTTTQKTISKGTKRIIVLTLVLASILMFALSDVLFDVSTNSAFGKIINFLHADNRNDLGSTSIRYYSITKVFSAFLHSPLYGWGYNGLIEQTRDFTRGMNTCTFINWFAVYGVVFGFIMLLGIIYFAQILSLKRSYRIVIVIFLFGITISENYIHCPIIFMLVLFGYLKKQTTIEIVTEQIYINSCGKI